MRARAGFSLVELMVVVAVIGILTSIALPSYLKFVARARQTEAKSSLAAVYTAEKTFYAENATYTECLFQIGGLTNTVTDGFGGHRAQGKSHYAVGFGSLPNKCGDGSQPCNLVEVGTCNYPADVCSYPNVAEVAANKIPSCAWSGMGALSLSEVLQSYGFAYNTTCGATNFTAAAAGSINSKNPRWDVWKISETRVLSNPFSGL